MRPGGPAKAVSPAAQSGSWPVFLHPRLANTRALERFRNQVSFLRCRQGCMDRCRHDLGLSGAVDLEEKPSNNERGSNDRQRRRRHISPQWRLTGFRPQVAFQQFVDSNWEAVAAIYEDRHLLWGVAPGARIVKRSVAVRRAKVRHCLLNFCGPLSPTPFIAWSHSHSCSQPLL